LADSKSRNIEVYAPRLILDSLGVEKLSPADRARLLGWWGKDVRPDYVRWRSGSCNWDSMLDAVWLLFEPGRAIAGVKPIRKWAAWFAWQLGRAQPQKGQPATVRYFGGRETLSNTYEPLRWGAVAAVHAWALRNRRPRLVELASAYTRAVCALLAPGAAPGPAKNLQSNERGQLFYSGPYMPQPGQRSTTAHVGQDDRGPLFALACGYPLRVSKRETWPARVARALGKPFELDEPTASGLRDFVAAKNPDPGFLGGLLKGVRLWAPVHHLRWKSVRTSYTPERRNTLTPCVFASRYDDAKETADVLYPWPGGSRGKNRTRDPGFCGPVHLDGKRWLEARNERTVEPHEKLIVQRVAIP
jgi:hypothetical protein